MHTIPLFVNAHTNAYQYSCHGICIHNVQHYTNYAHTSERPHDIWLQIGIHDYSYYTVLAAHMVPVIKGAHQNLIIIPMQMSMIAIQMRFV